MGDEPARCVLRIYIQLVLKKLILLFRRVFHYVVLHHHKESASLLKDKICRRCKGAEPQTNTTQCTGRAESQIDTGSTTFNMTTLKHVGQHGTRCATSSSDKTT